ncbi:IAA-amino acid hydrolase ILR1-like 1 [Camellia sinensis]|uniref:IAA-amino acid hydrolase ILR1-like 1 n=1 Tax=Camellia sinensis TaxID=4442 RepID=UPI001036AAE9|nr:IAA-amino acid hydrolase ILR1-like 1 [Camellia sinensis]
MACGRGASQARQMTAWIKLPTALTCRQHTEDAYQVSIEPVMAGHELVVTVAKFQGGSAFVFNVIPNSVTISGTFRAFLKESFRAFLKESLVQLKQRIEEVITRQTAVQRCNITVNFDDKPLYPSTVNNKELHRYFGNVARDMLGEKNGQLEPRHSLYFTVNEDVLLYGVAFHALLATRYRLEYQQPKSTSSKGSSHDEL